MEDCKFAVARVARIRRGSLCAAIAACLTACASYPEVPRGWHEAYCRQRPNVVGERPTADGIALVHNADGSWNSDVAAHALLRSGTSFVEIPLSPTPNASPAQFKGPGIYRLKLRASEGCARAMQEVVEPWTSTDPAGDRRARFFASAVDCLNVDRIGDLQPVDDASPYKAPYAAKYAIDRYQETEIGPDGKTVIQISGEALFDRQTRTPILKLRTFARATKYYSCGIFDPPLIGQRIFR